MIVPCLCCESIDYETVGEKNNHTIKICKKCKTLSANSQTSNFFDYDDYYSEGNLEIPSFVLERLAEIVAEFAAFRKTNRLLDVGCGAGSILKAAADVGWQAEGLEVSASSVEFLKNNGFKVFHGQLEEAAFPDNHFDVITAAEIIEHIHDPQKILNESFRILRPGGLFWGTTPNGQGLSSKILGSEWSCVAPPEHLQLFSIKGLKIMLKRAGFRRIEIKTHGINPFEIIEGVKQSMKSKIGKKDALSNGINRVQTSYELNDAFTASSWRKNVKGLLNEALNLARVGDSLKIKAVK